MADWDNQRDLEEYLAVLKGWGMSPERLRKLLRWWSPEDLESLLDILEHPRNAEKLCRSLMESVEARKNWAWLKITLREAAVYAAILSAGWVAVKLLWDALQK